eukprot:CAMPEP_0185750160 /NCGR_PEP_ID=MMETSP1174-20130828/8904_1 /TAXON_ID=35687 /ORGANISM="Dictyocha speculum, Strain CCMP1381" /LENGTH=92 /DNA_ID=CAMNT_0028426581 /DNA_START=32 /DNA_END=306 /DNA_ORIENTATION=+
MMSDMMLRVTVILALGIDITGAFQATSGWIRSTELKLSSNDLYAQPQSASLSKQSRNPQSEAASAALARRGGMDADSTVLVQGGSLRTWSYR